MTTIINQGLLFVWKGVKIMQGIQGGVVKNTELKILKHVACTSYDVLFIEFKA